MEITDNWRNKPINSLESIFRAWMPQTAASHEQRVLAMKTLVERFPKVGWKICVSQFHGRHGIGHYSHKPRWRADGYGYGEPFRKRAPVIAFMREMVEMALSWKNHTPDMLCDLIECLHGLMDEDQARVWELVRVWASGEASDADKAKVREKIRKTVLSRRGVKQAQNDAAVLTEGAKATYAALEPSDIVNKHEWLFRETWVEESADELSGDGFDYQKREQRVAKLRTDALREILKARGNSGVLQLAEMGRAAWQMGWLLGKDLLAQNEVTAFILEAFAIDANAISWSRKNLVAGVLRSLTDEDRLPVLDDLRARLSEADMIRVLLLAPFRRSIWKIVDGFGETSSAAYWGEIVPDYIFDDTESENREAVTRLIDAKRPKAAFATIHFGLEAIDAPLLYQLLAEMAKGGKEDSGHYQPQHYDVEKAFSIIDKSSELTLEEKASLEFTYIGVLSRRWGGGDNHGIGNLERYVEVHPELFVQAVVWAYKRKRGGEDPEEWKVPPENFEILAERGFKLLESLERIPGHNDLGDLDADRLAKWVTTVRDAISELDRREIGDVCLGKLFSAAPKGEDGVWPCEPVRQVMEEIQSEDISDGVRTGLYNSRGVHWRGEGGDQERELAAKYKNWENALHYSHPFVASTVHMRIAKSYEHEAAREDADAEIKRRLRH